MEKLNKSWSLLFGLSLAALAIQQLIHGDFIPIILPASFPAWLRERIVWTWIFSLLMLMGCLGIIFEIKARTASVILGSILLLFVICFQIPFQAGFTSFSLGSWTNAVKALALSGGAFIVSESFPPEKNETAFVRLLEHLAPRGKYFMIVLMISFGIDHFLYTGFVSTFVPSWIHKPVFWTYFTGVCLVVAGVGIMLNIYGRIAATLFGIMMFSWLFLLHLPRAIADPYSGGGNEWTSVFEVIAFGATAFLIGRPAAIEPYNRKDNKIIKVK